MSKHWSGSETMSNPNTYSLRILFVDDEPGLRLVIKNELQKQGHDVTVAEDGAAAIKLLEEHHYDCAITDLKMPNVDGWGVIRTPTSSSRQLTATCRKSSRRSSWGRLTSFQSRRT
jgi:CheY-like chemotaxis protein